MNDQNTTPEPDAPEKPEANSRSHLSPGSARPRSVAVSTLLAAAFGVFPDSIGASGLRMSRRHSSYRVRHHPDREKTPEDLERIEAARRKQERKAKKRRASERRRREIVENDGCYKGGAKKFS